jgi:hypothetical protein
VGSSVNEGAPCEIMKKTDPHRAYEVDRLKSMQGDDEDTRRLKENLKKIQEWLEAQDEEIGNAMLVSALIFTVSASAILQPHQATIESEHTDLYGFLLSLSVISNLGSVLFGTLMRRTLRYTNLHHAKAPEGTVEFIQSQFLAFCVGLPAILMWTGAITMSLGLALNVNVVFPNTIDANSLSRSCITMLACLAVILVGVAASWCSLDRLRQKYHLHGDFDLSRNTIASTWIKLSEQQDIDGDVSSESQE